MEKTAWTTTRLLQFLAFCLMFIVLPAGSYFYLKMGFDARMKAKAELVDLGKTPPFLFKDREGELVSNASFAGKLVVFAFPQSDQRSALPDRFFDQFENRSDLVVLSVSVDSVLKAPKDEAAQNVRRSKIWHHLAASDDGAFIKTMFDKAASTGRSFQPQHLVALVDTAGTIRRFYDLNDLNEEGRLVHHISLLLPSRD